MSSHHSPHLHQNRHVSEKWGGRALKFPYLKARINLNHSHIPSDLSLAWRVSHRSQGVSIGPPGSQEKVQSAGGRTSLEAHQCDQCDQPIYSDFPIPKMPAFLPSSCEKARFSLWCPSGVYGRLSVHNHGKRETGPWKRSVQSSKW